MQNYRGKRSLQAKKRRRQIYRLNKKHSHWSQKKEEWELLAEESLRQKCRERCAKYEALHLAEVVSNRRKRKDYSTLNEKKPDSKRELRRSLQWR